jgi:hypothetical protein
MFDQVAAGYSTFAGDAGPARDGLACSGD